MFFICWRHQSMLLFVFYLMIYFFVKKNRNSFWMKYQYDNVKIILKIKFRKNMIFNSWIPKWNMVFKYLNLLKIHVHHSLLYTSLLYLPDFLLHFLIIIYYLDHMSLLILILSLNYYIYYNLNLIFYLYYLNRIFI